MIRNSVEKFRKRKHRKTLITYHRYQNKNGLPLAVEMIVWKIMTAVGEAQKICKTTAGMCWPSILCSIYGYVDQMNINFLIP